MQRFASLAALIALLLPSSAFAYPFGGQISQVIPCYNNAIYAVVGPPRGGQFIWTPATQTYRYGAPSHAGQWLLGLTGIPYYCLVSVVPIITYPGISIMMMGSSQ